MDLSVNIAIGSSAQIALFAAPVLVLLSFFVGPFPMALVFNGLELGAIFLAILIANQVTHEGESTWFEGVQLLAVYVVLGHRVLLRRDDVRRSSAGPGLARAGGASRSRCSWSTSSCSRPAASRRSARASSGRSAGSSSRCAVAPVVWVLSSVDDAVTYTTVYFVERSLSLDNLFVFLLLFSYFAVPEEYRANLLFWGIVAALALRGAAILGGVALIEQFHFVIYILGALLLVLAWRILRGVEEGVDPDKNLIVRGVRKVFPVSDDFHGHHWFTKIDGRGYATPIFVCLAAIVAADIAFAVDSIPAAFAITRDSVLIWMGNIFALLGLRALFVLVEGLIRRFRYLDETIAVVLALVGVKLLIEDVVQGRPGRVARRRGARVHDRHRRLGDQRRPRPGLRRQARRAGGAHGGVNAASAQPGDVPAIAALLGRLSYPVEPSCSSGGWSGSRPRPRSSSPSAGEVVGLVGLDVRQGLQHDAPGARIIAFVVREDARRRGIARALLAAVEAAARAAGCEHLHVTTANRARTRTPPTGARVRRHRAAFGKDLR